MSLVSLVSLMRLMRLARLVWLVSLVRLVSLVTWQQAVRPSNAWIVAKTRPELLGRGLALLLLVLVLVVSGVTGVADDLATSSAS